MPPGSSVSTCSDKVCPSLVIMTVRVASTQFICAPRPPTIKARGTMVRLYTGSINGAASPCAAMPLRVYVVWPMTRRIVVCVGG